MAQFVPSEVRGMFVGGGIGCLSAFLFKLQTSSPVWHESMVVTGLMLGIGLGAYAPCVTGKRFLKLVWWTLFTAWLGAVAVALHLGNLDGAKMGLVNGMLVGSVGTVLFAPFVIALAWVNAWALELATREASGPHSP